MTTATLNPDTTVSARTTGDKLEGSVLVVILLTVGGFAGAASFTHVHDWTMTNSPAGTGDWFGWANAVVSELVPIAALLVMRRRRRTGQPVAYPVFLLTAALALSVTAQLAVAKPGFFGGLVSVVPALAFAALAKLVLGKTAAPSAGPSVPAAAVSAVPTSSPAIVPAIRTVEDRPVAVPDQVTTPATAPATATPSVIVPAVSHAVTDTTGAVSRPEGRPGWPDAPLPAGLLAAAREAAAAHLAEHGKPISRDELRKVLRVSNATTGDVMRHLGLRDNARTTIAAAVGTTPDVPAEPVLNGQLF